MENEDALEGRRNAHAVLLREFGDPQSVAQCGIVPVGRVMQGEVLLRMNYAPVNPADINVLEGKYGRLPPLPAVPGMEGVGTVVESRSPRFQGGERVLFPADLGTWRELGIVDAGKLIAVPDCVPLQQASMLRINPPTALCMLREIVSLAPGEWVLQNAANSGVGRLVIQIARILGLRTVNVVRRSGLVEELGGCGADAVLEEGPALAERIRGITGKDGARLALNAVGGECALELAKALGDSGSLVTYGAMARQPLRIPNGLLIFKDLRVSGFWVSRWMRQASGERVEALFQNLISWAAAGRISVPVAAVYPLSGVSEAVGHAMRGGRGGKVLLEPDPSF